MNRLVPHLQHAVAGVLATLAGMAAGHLVAGWVNPAASPVLAVGSTVIDLTPTPVKEWAIAQFGSRDKPILIGSVVLVTLLLAAAAGVLARRRPGLGVGVLVALVGTAGVLTLLRPEAGAADLLPALVAAAVAVPVLLFLTRLTARVTAPVDSAPAHDPAPDPAPDPVDPEVPGGSSGSTAPRLLLGDGAGPVPAPGAPGRRTVVVAWAAVAATSALAGWLGQHLGRLRSRPADVTLPQAGDRAAALRRGLEEKVRGISPFRTPNKDFYRVDVNLSVPGVDLDEWRLTIDGDVEREMSWTLDDLLGMDLVERDITLNCVSNPVGGPYVGSARWLGVPLADLMEQVGVGERADQILSTAVDGFTVSTPLEVALDGRDTLVAVGMNGEPLPAEHGFPARLLTPGLYGFVGATKWLRRLTLTTYDAETAYWTERGWVTDAPVKVASRVDTPRPFATVPANRVVLGGVAWAQHRGIEAVEVALDGGPWQRAELGPSAGVDYWRQWTFRWADAEPGDHMVAVRARTLDGEVQTAVRAEPFPSGATGIQSVRFTVE